MLAAFAKLLPFQSNQEPSLRSLPKGRVKTLAAKTETAAVPDPDPDWLL